VPALAEFEGTWTLTRQIADAQSGAESRFEGTARFIPDGDGLRYEEEGRLMIPRQPPMAATRRYLWRAGAQGIEVFFADGRFFHAIAPGPAPEACHDCPPDLYRVRFDFTAWPAWQAIWRVSGPRKDYAMQSVYRRDTAK